MPRRTLFAQLFLRYVAETGHELITLLIYGSLDRHTKHNETLHYTQKMWNQLRLRNPGTVGNRSSGRAGNRTDTSRTEENRMMILLSRNVTTLYTL